MRSKQLSRHWAQYQPLLFKSPDPELYFTDSLQKLLIILDVIAPERIAILHSSACKGRPAIDRVVMMRAFISKSVLNISDNKFLRERLLIDYGLRRICGFESKREIPCEATFSNVFREFSNLNVVENVHEDLIRGYMGDTLLEHISRDATAIPAREKPVKKEKEEEPAKRKKRGRPSKAEQKERIPKRIELQEFMTLEEMKEDLPTACDVGTKINAKGFKESWKGYKLHLDVTDHGIPISAILTSASTHDSQVAIPLETLTSERVTSLYSLMDAGYVSKEINNFVVEKGKVPIIANKKKPGESKALPLDPPQKHRFKNRSGSERANARLKDDFACKDFRVQGSKKVFTHLMLGVLVLAAEQIARHIL